MQDVPHFEKIVYLFQRLSQRAHTAFAEILEFILNWTFELSIDRWEFNETIEKFTLHFKRNNCILIFQVCTVNGKEDIWLRERPKSILDRIHEFKLKISDEDIESKT